MKDGLKYGTPETSVSVGTSSGNFLSANPDRVGLILSCPPTNRVTVSQRNPAVSGAGIVLNPGQNPVMLTAKFHGDLVTKQLFAIADVAAQTIGITEVIAEGIQRGQYPLRYPNER
jgi:hypothetical protein